MKKPPAPSDWRRGLLHFMTTRGLLLRVPELVGALALRDLARFPLRAELLAARRIREDDVVSEERVETVLGIVDAVGVVLESGVGAIDLEHHLPARHRRRIREGIRERL